RRPGTILTFACRCPRCQRSSPFPRDFRGRNGDAPLRPHFVDQRCLAPVRSILPPSIMFGGSAMKWPPLLFVVLILLSMPACSRLRPPAAAPPAASRDVARSELDRLQGSWRIESSLWNGVSDPEVMKSVTIVIQGDNFIWVDRDGN